MSSDIVFNVLCSGKIPPRHRKLPFILNSKLGWQFAGACESMVQPNSANSLFTVHVANQLDGHVQINNSWYYLEVPDIVQPIDEVCEASGSETVISNAEDWYVESLPMKVSPSKICDSIPHKVKEHSIEKGFDSIPELKEIHYEGKDVSDMCQFEVPPNDEISSNTESKAISISTDVKVLSDVSIIPSNIISVDFGIQCDLDNDVSEDLNYCANNMHLLSDPKVVLSGLKSGSCKEKSSTTNRVSDLQQPVVGATRQNVSSKNRSANKTHRGRINLPLFSTVVPAIILMFLSCRPFVAITTLSTGLVGV